VSYGIDNAQLLVWLDNSHVPEREHAGRLCRRHANALVVPRGWSIDDRRQPIPQLFRELERSLDPQGRGQVSPRGVKKQRKKPPTHSPSTPEPAVSAEPTLFEAVESAEPVTVEDDEALTTHVAEIITDDPDETRAIPWSPATTAENNPSSQDAPVMGRLLGRAFRQPGSS
jgi:hypothetical protein